MISSEIIFIFDNKDVSLDILKNEIIIKNIKNIF
jgi:hypothetical protein